MQRDTITVERFYTSEASRLGLKLIGGASGLKRIIREPTVNRPGLALSGFTRYFAGKRLQVMGNAGDHQVEGARKALGHAYGGGSQYYSMWVVGAEKPVAKP